LSSVDGEIFYRIRRSWKNKAITEKQREKLCVSQRGLRFEQKHRHFSGYFFGVQASASQWLLYQR